MKVALSHDWLNGMRGGEKCLEVFCELFPESSIYTLFYEKGKVSGVIAERPIFASFIAKLPGVYSHYRNYLPLFPKAVESFKLEGYDLVLSTSHCVAKGIKKPSSALHVCYCFTPMRYAWVLFEDYFGKKNIFLKGAIKFFIERLKAWDIRANGRVDHFVAISHHVKNRIREFYSREADVVYPPVDTDFYTPDPLVKRGDFYLIVSALVAYKRVDVAIQAFNQMGKRLVIIGDGPDKKDLEKMAEKNIEFMGWQSDAVLRDHYRRTKALIFPGEEDFGIVPLEVQACGGPVIAYAKGGALETVKEGQTGTFFGEATVESLKEAVLKFERMALDPNESHRNAAGFSKERFRREMKELIQKYSDQRPGHKA